ncbi:MAG TPA: uroporphyrinogen-III C-methyltransferase [Armatimonadota bacterium]|jgi:uroporphyrinogen III methyltransferase/synthase
MSGTVYLVGAGPGDPGLITVRGREAMERADVIVYDRLASPRLLRHARSEAEQVYVGKEASRHTLTQDEINALIIDRALAGQTVCRLKGGDPFVYGRGGEEAEACVAAGVPFVIVPGVTSAIAVPAYAGIPVTHRKMCSALGIVTGHEDPAKTESSLRWAALSEGLDTIVFLMGVENLPSIARELTAAGRPPSTPVALVRWGTTPEQETLTGTLGDIVERVREAGFKAPAVTIVGEVVSLRDTLRWWDSRPLSGKRIVVTRSREQASELSERLENLGAETVEFPTIRIQPIPEAAQSPALSRLPLDFDWIVFTSANTAPCLLDALRSVGGDVRSLGRAKIAAIGPATAETLTSLGLTVDYVPEAFVAESVLEGFPGEVSGARILIPRAQEARAALPDGLAERGAIVTVLPVYRTVPDAEGAQNLRAQIETGSIDAVTFTSSSTVRNFHAALPGISLDGVTVACIGPVTAHEARELGYPVTVVAETYSVPGLVEALSRIV